MEASGEAFARFEAPADQVGWSIINERKVVSSKGDGSFLGVFWTCRLLYSGKAGSPRRPCLEHGGACPCGEMRHPETASICWCTQATSYKALLKEVAGYDSYLLAGENLLRGSWCDPFWRGFLLWQEHFVYCSLEHAVATF